MTDAYRTDRWRGVLVLTLSAAGVGLLAKRPSLLLVSTVGVIYAVYPRLSGVSAPQLELQRSVSDHNPVAGSEIEVTTTVRNVGDRPILDLRLVDGVPPALATTDGTPRLGTALRAGESATVTYTMEATSGRHHFEPATVIVRDPSGGHELELSLSAETEIDCTTDLEATPEQSRTLAMPGRNPADSGGSGTEFYQTRSYRRGDPFGRVDWNRYARTGELSTIEFREERTASVVVVVDATPSAYRGADGEPHAVVAGVAAAQQLFESIIDGQNHVGLTAFADDEVWLGPRNGRRHRLRARELLATHAAFSARVPEPETTVPVGERVETLLARLSEDTTLLVISPLFDDEVTDAIQRCHAERHSVTVVSPDVIRARSDGQRLAAVERDSRLQRLRQAGVTTLEWPTDEPLEATLQRQMEAVAP